MKKIITADEQWMKAMNDLRNQGYDCDKVCEDLGAIGDNEFYHFYGKGKDLFFYKQGYAYGMYDCSGLDAATLLANNWVELNAKDDWYDKAMLAEFLLITAVGTDAVSPIPMEQLLWMHIFDATVKETAFIGEEEEVSTEEINAIRAEIVERCKGHSIEEIRDMFNAFNIGEYGDGSFDFLYDGLVFVIVCLQDKWHLSCIVCDRYSNSSDAFQTTELPIPPKEIKIDVEPKKVVYEDALTANLKSMVLHVRAMANLEIQRRWDAGQNFTEDDMNKWDEDYFNGLLVCDNKFTLENNENGILCLASNWRNDNGYEYLDPLDTVPIDELICILEMMH